MGPPACMEAPFPGTCRALLPRFYFNPATQACDCFIFGGCRSGLNNFVTLGDCMRTCGVHPRAQVLSPDCVTIFANINQAPPLGPFADSNHVNPPASSSQPPPTSTLSPANVDRLKEIFDQTAKEHIAGLDNTPEHKIPPKTSSDEKASTQTGGRPLLPPTSIPPRPRPTTTPRPLPPPTTQWVTATTTFAQLVQERQRQQLAETVAAQKQREAAQRERQQAQLESQRRQQQQLLEKHFGSGVRVKKAEPVAVIRS